MLAAAAICVAVSASAQQSQEVVYLKNGSVIHGSVLETIPGVSIKVRNSVGDIMVYPMEDVEKITKEAAAPVSSSSPARERLTLNLSLEAAAPVSSSSPASGSYAQLAPSSRSGCLTRAYRGFVDGGIYAGTLRHELDGEEVYRETFTRIGFTTTHGFQFNPHIFLGGGLGWQIQTSSAYGDYDLLFPIYTAFRTDFVDKRVSPFASFRLGGYASLSCVDIDNIVVGAYVNLNFGVRIKRLNMSIGYEAMPGYASLEIYDNGQYDFYDYNLRINSFVFRMGVDIGRRVD